MTENEKRQRRITIWVIVIIMIGCGVFSIVDWDGEDYDTTSNSTSSYSQSNSNTSSYSSQSDYGGYSPNPGNKYSWLRGYWQCATPYGSMFLLIDGKGRISSKDEDGNIEAGSYTVDDENNELRVHFDKEPEWLITTYKLQNQQIYFGSGLWYYKFAPY